MADLALAAGTFTRFRDLVAEKSGLELGDIHRPNLERAVAQALLDTGSSTDRELLRLLADPVAGRAPLESFLASLTIGETHFFRNAPQFEALRATILPALIEARSAQRRLRVWSAGCASGEEPYSIAMLIDRLLPKRRSWDVTILATDINPRAMEKARRGVYGRWSFREVPPEFEHAYFRHAGADRELDPEIRAMVTFRYLNLVQDVYPSLITNTVEMDLIFCRNVLIYFRNETNAMVAERLHRSLTRDGWLLVGHAEPSRTIADPWFDVVPFPDTIAYRRRDVTPAPAPAPAPRTSQPSVPDAAKPAPLTWSASRPSPRPEPERPRSVPVARDAIAAYRTAKACASRLELDAAEHWISVAVAQDPLFAPAHHLYALILQERGMTDSALGALRRCVYADRRFVLGHFTLATLLRSRGETARADKSLDNVLELLEGRPLDDPIAEGDGLTVGRLRELVDLHRQLAPSVAG